MKDKAQNSTRLPLSGIPRTELLQSLKETKQRDADWKQGRMWGLVYYAGEEHTELLNEAYRMFFSENALGITAFPSLKKLESEVVSMLSLLLGGDPDTKGTMTSGGTESILLAVKTYRDLYRTLKPAIIRPEMILSCTAHPAFLKAAQYFDLNPVIVPVDADYRVDLQAVRNACNSSTILIVGSAPTFSHGVVDPVPELGEIALEHGTGLHVDACLGGFMLPFLRKLGYETPSFDFSVPGVTSISADLHKYAYSAKGASAVLYRNSDIRRHQFFVSTQWTGGLYLSPTMLGTRSGGNIAASWAALMSLGEEGYLEFSRKTIEGAERLFRGITELPGMEIVGKPAMTVFAFTSNSGNIFSIASRMEQRGWRLHRQNNPPSIHLVVTLNHLSIIDQFLEDLKSSVQQEIEAPLPIDKSEEQQFILYDHESQNFQNENTERSLIDWFEEIYDA